MKQLETQQLLMNTKLDTLTDLVTSLVTGQSARSVIQSAARLDLPLRTKEDVAKLDSELQNDKDLRVKLVRLT